MLSIGGWLESSKQRWTEQYSSLAEIFPSLLLQLRKDAFPQLDQDIGFVDAELLDTGPQHGLVHGEILVADVEILGGAILAHADRSAEPGHAAESRGVDPVDQWLGAGVVLQVDLCGPDCQCPLDNVEVAPVLARTNRRRGSVIVVVQTLSISIDVIEEGPRLVEVLARHRTASGPEFPDEVQFLQIKTAVGTHVGDSQCVYQVQDVFHDVGPLELDLEVHFLLVGIAILALGVQQNIFQGGDFAVANLFDRAGEFGVVGIEGQFFSDFRLVIVVENAPIDSAVFEEIPGIFVRSAPVKDYESRVVLRAASRAASASDLEHVELDGFAAHVVATGETLPRVFEF